MQNFDQKAFDIRPCNAVAWEVREIEKREKNVVIFNVVETSGKKEEEQKQIDMETIRDIFKELNFGDIDPTDAVRIGRGEKYPKSIRTTLRTTDECEKIVQKCWDRPKLKNNVFIMRDRTFNKEAGSKAFPDVHRGERRTHAV